VIIIDEAHNLIETINQLHSAELSVLQIDAAAAAIAAYTRRYQTQLSGKNLYYINILSAVLAKVKKVLCPKAPKAAHIATVPVAATACAGGTTSESSTSAAPASTSCSSTSASVTFTVNDFLFKSGLDSVNLFKLKRHITETNLVNKIGGYAEAQARLAVNTSGTVHIHGTPRVPAAFTAAVGALRCALELVMCLTNIEGDGRIFLLNIAPAAAPTGATVAASIPHSSSTAPTITASADKSTAPPPSVRYVMLNPSVHFAPIVSQARSVVLLGGTMQPFSYFTSLLFPNVPRERLRLLSCEHVVPASQVGALIVPYTELDGASTGAAHKRVNFEFTYDKRLQVEITNALFAALVEICANTPGGVVVFCTSFQYLDALLSRWRASRMLPKLDAIKRVFAESRASSSNTSAGTEEERGTAGAEGDSAWEGYKKQIENNPVEGALLFSVINGKLSEGINFSDQLARCVVVVGLPYPDVRDPVLQEKMRYVSAKDTAGTAPSSVVAVAGGAVSAGGNSGGVSVAGRRLCESMCMKAVNQSIGRAIRHVRDYACIVLLDRRYQQEQFRCLLPAWILRSVRCAVSGGGGGGGGGGAGSVRGADAASGAYEGQRAGVDESARLGKGLKDFFAQQK
jgi:chromosome transmission fidelity protein 1